MVGPGEVDIRLVALTVLVEYGGARRSGGRLVALTVLIEYGGARRS